MMLNKQILVSLVMLSLAVVGKSEGTGITGAEFLLEEISAATAALAAGQADSRGMTGIQKNPASILGQTKPSFSFTHFATFGDTAYEQIGGLLPNCMGGNLAARIFYASTYDFPDINEFGQEVGTVANHDMLMHIVYARRLIPTLEIGTAVKYFESALAEFQRAGIAMDFGVRWQTPLPPLAVGISLQNIGTMSKFAETSEQLPTVFNSGIAINLYYAKLHQVKILADISAQVTGDSDSSVLAGVEYIWNQIVFLRGGYRFEDELGALSMGGGIQYAGFGLDYAYQPLQDLGVNHRFTLYYVFGMGE